MQDFQPSELKEAYIGAEVEHRSALDEDELSTSLTVRLILGEAPGIHWIGDWVEARAVWTVLHNRYLLSFTGTYI